MQEKVIEAKGHTIDFENNLFRKGIPLNKFQCELEMSQRAYDLASGTELFDTPFIKTINSENNEIDFELLTDITTLREYFISQSRFGTSTKQLEGFKLLFYKIGESLQFIHSGQNYFEGISKNSFPETFFKPVFIDDQVYIHGDFTLKNILFNNNSNKLYIIDWSTSPNFKFSANYGPRYWDLSFFISSLFYFSFSTFFSFKVRKELSISFLSGYLNKSNIDKDSFLIKMGDFLSSYNYYRLYSSIYKSNNSTVTKFLIKYSKKKLDVFIDSLPGLLK